jgi:hypothetical protein
LPIWNRNKLVSNDKRISIKLTSKKYDALHFRNMLPEVFHLAFLLEPEMQDTVPLFNTWMATAFCFAHSSMCALRSASRFIRASLEQTRLAQIQTAGVTTAAPRHAHASFICSSWQNQMRGLPLSKRLALFHENGCRKGQKNAIAHHQSHKSNLPSTFFFL